MIASENPFDTLLVIIWIGYLFSSLLAYHFMKLYNFKGLLWGILTNAVIHFNILYNGERLAVGNPPTTPDLIKQLIFLVAVNLFVSLITYFFLSKKGYPPKLLTALGLFLSSIFFVECYIPALYVLIMLILPFREDKLGDPA